MKKLGIVLIVVAIVLLALIKISPQTFAVGEGMSSMRIFGMAVAGTLAMGFLGGWFLFAPMVLRRSGMMINLVGLVLVIPLSFLAYQKASSGALPALARSFNNRWGGSFVDSFAPGTLDEISTWLAEMDETKEPTKVVNMSLALGGYLQRLGRVPESIVHLERAHRVVNLDSYPEVDSRPAVARNLGIAYLREGEIASCLKQPNEHSCIFPLHEGGVWTDTTYAKKAEAMFFEVLELTPDDPGAPWLLALSQQVMGTYPDNVAEGMVLPEATMLGETTSPHFRNRAVALGIAGDDNAGSVVMDDFDNDGFMDIITCSYDPGVPLTYQHNNGDGTFSNWTAKAGLTEHTGGLNLTHADYNNDGRLDILLLRGAWFMTMGYQRNTLLRQEEDGTFTDVTMESGLGDQSRPTLAATWGDYDLDGDLDVYLGNERLAGEAFTDPERGFAPCELFRNNGDGTFTDVAEEAGVRNMRFTRGAAFGDYDNDGWPDLVVSNLSQENRLYHNNGDGTFTDIGPEVGGQSLLHPIRAFCSWFVDVNNDGNLDIYLGGYPLGGTVNEVMLDRYGKQENPRVERCSLLLGDGKGGFTDASAEWNIDRVHLPMGANFGDIDSDGWIDLYMGTGAPALEIIVPNVLYRNIEGKQFLDATTASGTGHLHKGHGISMGDIDNDGDLDIYAQLGGWYVDSHSQNALFLNEGTPNHSLTLHLEGKTANRFGKGARIRTVFEDGGVERVSYTVAGDTGSFGGNPMEVFLGLGGATVVKELEITWPNREQTKQVLRNVPVDKALRIVEGADTWAVVEQRQAPMLVD